MSDEPSEPRKLFTVAQANAMLPLVRAIVTDLVSLTREVVERRQRMAHLFADDESADDSDADDAESDASRDDPYRQERRHVEEQMGRDAQRLRELVDELRELGVEPKDALMGLVDFPAVRDGRTICLCWKLDEPEVQFWHEWEAGFAGRQPLAPASVVAPSAGE
jgi:hypothetical protein